MIVHGIPLAWIVGVAVAGLALGALAAAIGGGWRVLLKTVAAPAVVGLARIFVPGTVPRLHGPAWILADIVLMAAAAFAADWLVGWASGASDARGYRHDSVGH